MLIHLRPAGPADFAFARDVYVETMAPYVRRWMRWIDDEQRDHFIRLWQPADTQIIIFQDVDVGWVEVTHSSQEIFVQQICVREGYRGLGIGSLVLGRLLEEWRTAEKRIALGVLKNNPARRLYERLGFGVFRETRAKFFMVHTLGGEAAFKTRSL